MKTLVITMLMAASLSAKDKHPSATPQPTIYIEPQGGFEAYLSAGFFKKHVPATIANDKAGAKYTLKSSNIATQEEKTGLGKLARCAYALCLGIDGTQTLSVQLTDAKGQIVWAYSVRKVGASNYQSSAEAVAKHLKGFLEDQPTGP